MTPMRDPADRALTRPRLRGLAASAAVVVLAAVGAAVLGAIRPPAARPVTAPAQVFSVVVAAYRNRVSGRDRGDPAGRTRTGSG
ncbi:MAG: hypothetical protein QOE51_298 [Actinoplanes sp.]|jgi:hypothetical protein|nr:hypothetical protein [Actinoplanes sp.]